MITRLASEQALVVDGAIGLNFETHVRDALNRHPDTKLLVVRSPGGMRGPALRIAELINARRVTVRISGNCASACALLWAAAQSREMTFGSRLGLHASRLPDALRLPGVVERHLTARNDRQTDQVLRDAGFSQRLITSGARTPPVSMSWFAPMELKYEGVPFVLRDDARRWSVAANAAVAASSAPQRMQDAMRH